MHRARFVLQAVFLAVLLVVALAGPDALAQGSAGGSIGNDDKSVSGSRPAEARRRRRRCQLRRRMDIRSHRLFDHRHAAGCDLRRRAQPSGRRNRAGQSEREPSRDRQRKWPYDHGGRPLVGRHRRRHLFSLGRLWRPLDGDEAIGERLAVSTDQDAHGLLIPACSDVVEGRIRKPCYNVGAEGAGRAASPSIPSREANSFPISPDPGLSGQSSMGTDA
jgi:hypothetical protein